jgi:transposase-like protein
VSSPVFADKRRQAIDILRDSLTSGHSNAEIGRLLEMSPEAVARIRQEVEAEGSLHQKGILQPLDISLLRMDGGTQPRAKIDEALVQEYRDDFRAGDHFPPVIVFFDGTSYWLADGFHRVRGAKLARKKTILAEIRQGTQRDAILYSVGANRGHGLRRTNEDKARAVMRLLNDEEWHRWNNVEIARKCGVSEFMVRKHRPESILDKIEDETQSSTHRKVERNGIIYEQDISNMGKASVPVADPDEEIEESEEILPDEESDEDDLVEAEPDPVDEPDPVAETPRAAATEPARRERVKVPCDKCGGCGYVYE